MVTEGTITTEGTMVTEGTMMARGIRKLAGGLAACLLGINLIAVAAEHRPYIPTQDNLEAREDYRDMKFGIFVTFGMSTLLGLGAERPYGSHYYFPFTEWTMQTNSMRADRYEEIAEYFNPDKFDAREWAETFAAAGARYVTITTKLHDGFCIFDSRLTDYDIVDRTEFGRDILKELKRELDKRDIAMFVYYSQLDWHHPDYFPRGKYGHYAGRPDHGNWDNYLKYQNGQLRELFTNYGDVAGVWFDGYWDRDHMPNKGDWRLRETYDLIHDIQPRALIMNNHHVAPFPGEDIQVFEKDLPGEQTQFFNTAYVSDTLPLETIDSMNKVWAYNLQDEEQKSTAELIKLLVGAAGRNANLLLNTGPRPDGQMPSFNVKTLKEIGAWLKVHGEAIYGTRGGPIGPRSWGVTTQNEEAVYVHIADWDDSRFFLPFNEPNARVSSATLLRSGESVEFKIESDGVLLRIPSSELDANIVTVLKLKIEDARTR